MRSANSYSFKGFRRCKPANGSMSSMVISYCDLFKDAGRAWHRLHKGVKKPV